MNMERSFDCSGLIQPSLLSFIVNNNDGVPTKHGPWALSKCPHTKYQGFTDKRKDNIVKFSHAAEKEEETQNTARHSGRKGARRREHPHVFRFSKSTEIK